MVTPISKSSPDNRIEPLVVDTRISALLHAGDRNTGILICGGWGYEDLLTRTAMSILARRLSSRGFMTLRFDYPNCGDSLDQTQVTLDDWISAARSSLQELKHRGPESIILVGHGFGSIIARMLANLEPDISGVVLMASTNPRRFLRETKHLGAMLSSRHDVPSSDDLKIAGFRLPDGVHAALSKMKDPTLARPLWTLTVDPAMRAEASPDAAANTTGLRIPYPDFEALMTDPILQKIPVETIDHVVEVLDERFPRSEAIAQKMPAAQAFLQASDFREQAFFFGSKSLYGVLCEPSHMKSDKIAIFLNTGKNPHIGWGRSTIHYARSLASAGIASFRFDVSGIGDSFDDPAAPQATLFSEYAVTDVQEACDAVALRGYQKISLMGVCSGAYLGLLSAVKDKRVERLFAVNLPRFAWYPSESVREVVRFSNRPADHTARRLFKPETLRAIMNGTLDPRPAIKFKGKSLLRHASIRTAPFVRRLSPQWNVYSTAWSRMNALAERNVNVLLAYSAGDDSPKEMELLFGRDGKRLPGRENIAIHHIEGVDHNFSQAHAIQWMTTQMISMMDVGSASETKNESAMNVMAGQLMFG